MVVLVTLLMGKTAVAPTKDIWLEEKKQRLGRGAFSYCAKRHVLCLGKKYGVYYARSGYFVVNSFFFFFLLRDFSCSIFTLLSTTLIYSSFLFVCQCFFEM